MEEEGTSFVLLGHNDKKLRLYIEKSGTRERVDNLFWGAVKTLLVIYPQNPNFGKMISN